MANVKKVLPVTLLVAFGLILVANYILSVKSTPNQGSTPTCHSKAGYSITTTNGTSLTVTTGTNFTIEFTASGSNADVEVPQTQGTPSLPGCHDNDKFTVVPSQLIPNNSSYNLAYNPTTNNSIEVYLNFTAPTATGSYQIMVITRDPNVHNQPQLNYILISISVGTAAAPALQINVASHMSIYIGLAAILCLAVGTLAYKLNTQLTRAHGILAGSAIILTTINIILIIPTAASVVNAWVNVPGAFTWSNDWIHLTHIILGIVGYGAGIVAVFTGVAGIRSTWPGYIALICWSINFGVGLLYWGVAF